MKVFLAVFVSVVTVTLADYHYYDNADCDHQCGYESECNLVLSKDVCGNKQPLDNYRHQPCYRVNRYTCVKRGFVAKPVYYGSKYSVGRKGYGDYTGRDYYSPKYTAGYKGRDYYGARGYGYGRRGYGYDGRGYGYGARGYAYESYPYGRRSYAKGSLAYGVY